MQNLSLVASQPQIRRSMGKDSPKCEGISPDADLVPPQTIEEQLAIQEEYDTQRS